MGVYTGIAQDNATINGGTLSAVDIKNSAGGSVQLRTVTATQLADIGYSVNVMGKAAGTVVFETTNSRLMVATGANANSTWVRADGSNAVTPS